MSRWRRPHRPRHRRMRRQLHAPAAATSDGAAAVAVAAATDADSAAVAAAVATTSAAAPELVAGDQLQPQAAVPGPARRMSHRQSLGRNSGVDVEVLMLARDRALSRLRRESV
jgi:hypothetical protein